jgi:hypothetical protein
LYRWGIPRDQHLKKAGKAKLLVTEARREDLERVLADPSVAEELKETEAAAVAVVTAAGAKERPKREKKGKKEKKEKKVGQVLQAKANPKDPKKTKTTKVLPNHQHLPKKVFVWIQKLKKY